MHPWGLALGEVLITPVNNGWSIRSGQPDMEGKGVHEEVTVVARQHEDERPSGLEHPEDEASLYYAVREVLQLGWSSHHPGIRLMRTLSYAESEAFHKVLDGLDGLTGGQLQRFLDAWGAEIMLYSETPIRTEGEIPCVPPVVKPNLLTWVLRWFKPVAAPAAGSPPVADENLCACGARAAGRTCGDQ